jgi:hypothetical protein
MWGVVVAGLVGLLGVAPVAHATGVYEYRGADGTRVFTNVPSEPARPARLAPITIVTGAGFGFPRMAGDRTPYDALIREIASRYDVEYALVKAMIKAESAFDPRAVSSKGAQGLMQLMPATAADYAVEDAFTPRDNIEGGVRHLRMLLDRYDNNVLLAVAAYNAGHGRVEQAGGIPPLPETQAYVERVLRYRAGYLREAGRGGFRR